MVQGSVLSFSSPGSCANSRDAWAVAGAMCVPQEFAVQNGEDTVAVLELLVPVAWGVVLPQSLELYGLGVICSRHTECVPVFTALEFRGRTENPSIPQARVGELSRARAAGSMG